MVVAFPIVKLGALFVKQVSRPLANQIKNGAKRSSVFRRFVCLPVAQFYHKVEMTRRMVWLGFGKPVDVPALNEEAAVELGANLVGEMIVYLVAVLIVLFEYNRTNEKARIKELELRNQIADLEYKLKFLDIQMGHHDAELRNLERHMASRTRFYSETHRAEAAPLSAPTPSSGEA